MTHSKLRQKLILAGKILAEGGQSDFTRGHISIRLPSDPTLFLMKAHSVGFEEITPRSILTINLRGEVVAGKGRRHSEVFIHSEILKARQDVNCVIHTHPPYAIAFSAIDRPVKAYSQAGALFHNSLGIYNDSISLVRNSEMGAGVAKALGPHRAALLKNHGAVVAAPSVEEAVISAIMLETAAMIQMIVEATGKPATEFSVEDIETLKRQLSKSDQFQINFDYLTRQVKRSGK